MLALNFQTSTTAPMLINWAKFRENGSSGFNLRPQWLNQLVPASGSVQCGDLVARVERFSRPIPTCDKVRIQIFGARMLPRGNACVEVQLHDGGGGTAIQYRSSVCKTDSFSPDFDFDRVFPIQDSANAYFTFTVYSKDVSMAYYCIPLECMRQGYRAIHLVDSLYDPIAKGLSHLFVHVRKISNK